MRLILIFALALLAPFAQAQTVPGNAVIGWTLPTDGCTVGVTPCDKVSLATHPITGVEVFISTSPIPDNPLTGATLKLSATSTTTTYTTTVANGSTLYARLRAVGEVPGALSAQVSKLIKLDVAPGLPTNVTFTIQITS